MLDEREVTTGIVPGFGKDPRDEALGGTWVGLARELKGKMVERDGGREKWLCFEKRTPLRTAFGRLNGWIRCEVAAPSPLLISRHAASLPLLLHLSYSINPSFKTLPKLKPIYLDKIVATLSAKTLTRGGPEEAPRFSIEEIRRVEIKLWDTTMEPNELRLIKSTAKSTPGAVDAGKVHMRLVPTEVGHDVKVGFDLQSTELGALGKINKALKDSIVSFRTPNLEMEYILSVTIQPVGQESFYCLRTPIQILAGDHDEVAPFTTHLLGTPAHVAPTDSLPLLSNSMAGDEEPPDYHEG
ncbi:hypothetical protein P7C70_g8928, partial [Phenoliferia sp. Uapishka_3]